MPMGASTFRVTGFSNGIVNEFFNVLHSTADATNRQDNKIYNADEPASTPVPKKSYMDRKLLT